MTIADSQKIAWLRLIRSQNVGPIVFWELMKFYSNAERALEAIPELSARSGRRLQACSIEQAEKEYQTHLRQGFQLLAAYEPGFPATLKNLPDCPPVLSIKGNIALLQKPVLGVVGSRNASLNSCRFAKNLASDLGKRGWTIASGLARGIDCQAHDGSLATGTIAVLAGGADHIYPPEHERLYEKIALEGAIISEMPLGLFAAAKHFPRRNRLISGLSRGVVVVDAALKSGSMITARYANEQGREVFAVPGSPLDPRSRGCHALIKDGAQLLESAEDVDRVLGQPTSPQRFECAESTPELVDPAIDLADLRAAILIDLDYTPISIDILQRKLRSSPGQINLVLLELELAGLIQRLPNQTVVRLSENEIDS